MRRIAAKQVAFGGMMAALALVIMGLGGLIPVATYVCPMLCMLLRKKPELLSMITLPRQIVNIAYLAIVYFLADKTPWDLMPLLVGAAVGLTGAVFLFTRQLLKTMDGGTPQEKEREGDDNG